MRHLGLPPLAPVVGSKAGRIREEEAQAVRQCHPPGRPRAMKLQAVMENLQRQQRARLQQELEARQQQELDARQQQQQEMEARQQQELQAQDLHARQHQQQEMHHARLQQEMQARQELQTRQSQQQELHARQQQELHARQPSQPDLVARQPSQPDLVARQPSHQEQGARDQEPDGRQKLEHPQHAQLQVVSARTSPPSANQNSALPGHVGMNLSFGTRGPPDESEPEAVRIQRAQVAALAAMRAAAAGLSQESSPGMSEDSFGSEDDEQERDSHQEDRFQDMGSEEEDEEMKRKWDEDDFEEDMEEDYDDDMDEGLVVDTEKSDKGLVLNLKRPTQQLFRGDAPRPSGGLERLSSGFPLPGHSQLTPQTQDHGDWTYEEQFKQLYELDSDQKRKEFLDDLFSFMQKRGTPVNRIPIMAKQVLDLYMLYVLVTEKGGLVEVINKKLWREITKGLNLPTSITSAAFTLRTQYMKYLYPYECDKRALSNPNELQAAIDSNRREGRRSGFGGNFFTYSPSGAPNLLSPPKLQGLGLANATNGGCTTLKVKKEEEASVPIAAPARVPVSLAGHSKVSAAQAAALENLREKMECGEPPEKKMGLSGEEQQRAMHRALQHNLLAMSAQLPMSIRINSQGESRQDSAVSLTMNGTNSISMSVEINGIVYTGVLFAQTSSSSSSAPPSSYSKGSSNRVISGGSGAQPPPGPPVAQTATPSNPSP
ncbi:AT-rich interactive domain-containing protein 3A [Ambystoma mexicanum]|uniref:AT-rich interactive domain-containing protein 3A n=1 Tax=Ambystoma mexicanum TaxID=8296 RepID=UPI0037E80199